MRKVYTQQTWYIDPMLDQCWPTVCDVGPTLFQRWVDVSYLLGIHAPCIYQWLYVEHNVKHVLIVTNMLVVILCFQFPSMARIQTSSCWGLCWWQCLSTRGTRPPRWAPFKWVWYSVSCPLFNRLTHGSDCVLPFLCCPLSAGDKLLSLWFTGSTCLSLSALCHWRQWHPINPMGAGVFNENVTFVKSSIAFTILDLREWGKRSKLHQ